MKPPTGHTYRQNDLRRKIRLKAAETRSMAARTTAVTWGEVRSTELNRASNRNEALWSQMPRRRLGQRKPGQRGALAGGARMAPLCNHSPGSGIGHTAHQARPATGTVRSIRAPHQAIQMKTMLKLALPTGVPRSPMTMASRK